MIRKAFLILLAVAAIATGLLVRATVSTGGWQIGDGKLREARYWGRAIPHRPNQDVFMMLGYRTGWRPLVYEQAADAYVQFLLSDPSYGFPDARQLEAWVFGSKRFTWGALNVSILHRLWFDVWEERAGAGDYHAEPETQMSVASDGGFYYFTEPTQEADCWLVSIGAPGSAMLLFGYGATVLLAAWPSIALVRGVRRWRRQRKKGMCLKCGYNLTGNVSGTCPECGSPRGADTARSVASQGPKQNT
jgi:hypothetical protein